MVTIEDILGRKNKQSMDRQQMQQQVYNTPAVTPPAPTVETPPANALTLDEVEEEKNSSNGDVVQLGDQKPQQSPTQSASTPTTPEGTKPDEVPDFSKSPVDAGSSVTKPTMPGTQVTKSPKLDGVNTMPKSLKEWVVWNNEMKRRAGIKSDEEMEKARRRDSVLAAIGDGISSLAQLYYANQGAIVNQNTGNSLSENVAKRHEQLRRENDLRENQLLNWMRERRNAEIAKQQQKANDEYRKEVLEQRREQNRINADFKKAEQERKAEELKLKQDKEERQKAYDNARIELEKGKADAQYAKNAVFNSELMKELEKGSSLETARTVAALRQQQHDEAEKAKSKSKGSSRSGRGRSGSRGRGRSGSRPRGNGYGGSGSPGTGYD